MRRLLPWLLVTTGNLARNHARGLRRYRAFLARLPRGDEAVGDDASAALAAADPWAALDEPWARALAQLSAADLRLVILVVLEEQPLVDAGALLGLTPQAAKSRMHRARQRLRAAMPRDGDPPLAGGPPVRDATRSRPTGSTRPAAPAQTPGERS